MTPPQRRTLVAAIVGSALATIDGTVVNVALPAIERDLGGGLSSQQWVSNGLQQVAGYSALRSGLSVLPVTLVVFALSRRFGALADRYGPRLFMGAGPLVGAAGLVLLLRTGTETSYLADLVP